MCQTIFIGSEKELPHIPWNDENPGFCIDDVLTENELEFITPILGSAYYYDIGSFMGCTCGFSYGSWSKESNDNHLERIKNTQDLKDYLSEHLAGNTILLFGTSWDNFPDSYTREVFSLSDIHSEEFYLEDDIIFQVEE